MNKIKYFGLVFFSLLLWSCEKDMMDDVDNENWNNERNILGIAFKGQIGEAIINRDGDDATIEFVYNPGSGSVSAIEIEKLEVSYHATPSVKVGETIDFDNETNSAKITITSHKGETLDWTLKMRVFDEVLVGTWKVKSLTVFGGTGPEYGGAAILAMVDKPWCWPSDGPQAEEDNMLTFTLDGVDELNNTYGTIHNDAGADGLYADFRFILNTDENVNQYYRTIPKGDGKWYRDYNAGTVKFEFEDGTTKTAAFQNAGSSIDVGYGVVRQLSTESFMFNLQGVDDWGAIYSDYDKFVKNPRKYWIDIEKQ